VRTRTAVAAALLVIATAAGACTSGGRASPSSPSGSSAAASSGGLIGNATERPPAPGPGEFVNPVLDTDFPDPFVLKVGDTWWAYATEGNAQHIQVARSNDLASWEQLDDALPQIPAWSLGRTWAPEVTRIGTGYVMYYAADAFDFKTPRQGDAQCITTAVSSSPQGPFADPNSKPLLCQPELGGSIDPSPFQDRDGKRYLLWKNDGNCCDIPTRLYVQQLSDDGRRLMGKPTDTGLVNDSPWETRVNSRIESPELLLHDGTYYLFFSGSADDTEFAAVGYATSKSVTGPYVDAPENPILVTRDPAFGPGHPTITQGPDGRFWMLYHAWNASYTYRALWLDELVFEAGRPVVKGPDVGPETAPLRSPAAASVSPSVRVPQTSAPASSP
jgi:beta-xylosidase